MDEMKPVMPEKNDKKSGKRRWRRFLLLWALLLLAAGILGCAILYRYLAVYESTLPEHVMDALMDSTSPETWRGYVHMGLLRQLDQQERGSRLQVPELHCQRRKLVEALHGSSG